MKRGALGIVAFVACTPHSDVAPVPSAHPCSGSSHAAGRNEPTLVGGSVYVLSVDGGNVVIEKGARDLVIVDPRAAVVDAMAERFAPGRTRTVIVTHSHRDHTSGSGVVARGGTILAHANVSGRLVKPQIFRGMAIDPAPAGDLPTRTYETELQLDLGGEAIALSHPPGAHTDGDTVVHFVGSHVVALGDLYFPDHFPYVDPDGGGNVSDLVRAIDGLVRDLPDDTQLVPGHGRAPCSMADLRVYQHMLHDTVDWVRAGKSGLPPAYASWAWDFVSQDEWIGLVARTR